ncbi:hypothetical protein SVIOM342S_06904 [Streptomyces violaceorubidus]
MAWLGSGTGVGSSTRDGVGLCKSRAGRAWCRRGRRRTGRDGRSPDGASPRPRGQQRPSASASAPADPEAARRRAERRAERITAGATELEQRLADLLRAGLAGAERTGHGLWEETAARMVDAQAPELALAPVRELGAIPSSGPGWPVRLLEECTMLASARPGLAAP